MIPLSSAAESALAALTNHYALLGRDRAIDRLVASIEAACERFERERGQFYDSPRPYPGLAELGLRWTKEGPYWIAFAVTREGPIVAGVFHDGADIPNRI